MCLCIYGVWFDQLPGGRGGGGFDFDDHITERLICTIYCTYVHMYILYICTYCTYVHLGRGGGGFDFDDHITERLLIEFVQNDTFVGLR